MKTQLELGGVQVIELEIVLHKFLCGRENVVGDDFFDTRDLLQVSYGSKPAGGEGVYYSGTWKIDAF